MARFRDGKIAEMWMEAISWGFSRSSAWNSVFQIHFLEQSGKTRIVTDIVLQKIDFRDKFALTLFTYQIKLPYD